MGTIPRRPPMPGPRRLGAPTVAVRVVRWVRAICAPSEPGGGVKQPKAASIARASVSEVRSPQAGPMIWMPAGMPCTWPGKGRAVAGRCASVAMPGQNRFSM